MLFVSTGYALEVGKVNVPESITAGGSDLVLNGAGIRSKFGLKLYVGSLFLPQKSNDAQAIMAADEPMAIRLNIISGMITSEKMEDATREGFENATKGNIAPIKSEIESFIAVFKEPIKEGDTFDLVYVPAKGVEVYKNGEAKSVVGNLEFKKALFGIWLCDKPAQKSLKEGMLGL
ncbi:MAG: chalcone isomerase family protein [Deltaproteobacteria bacterium]|jgi:hypothetical protein|nr:chalcone isomerase family protein [Deltaproteobacteria bacterium]